jgi:beta-lactamase regulating signal transducer with metallopeptidase domain
VLINPHIWLEFLLDMTIKGTALMAVVFVIFLIPKKITPASRYFLLFCAVFGIVVLPFLTYVLPSWDVPLFPRVLSTEQAVSFPGGLEKQIQPEEFSLLGDVPLSFAEASKSPFSWTHLIFLIWGAGGFCVFVRLLASLVRARRICAHALPVPDKKFMDFVDGIAPGLRIQLLESSRLTVPLAFGWLKPKIVLPAEMKNWSRRRIELVLTHEAAHIRRGDVVSTIIAHTASIFYWFNPLVWLALRLLYVERERACDDYVLAAGAKASDYASHLLDIARNANALKWLSPAGAAMAKKTFLEVRLMSILSDKKRKFFPNRPAVFVAGLLIFSCILTLASIETWAQSKSQQSTPKPDQKAQVLSDEEAVKKTLKEFYDAIEAQDFKKAVEFFKSFSETEKGVNSQSAFIVSEDEKNKKIASIKKERFKKLEVDSRLKSVKKQGNSYVVTEDLTINCITQENKEKTLVRNPDHQLIIEKKDGSWKISDKATAVVTFKPVKPSKLESNKIGLCFTQEGIKCMVMATHVELNEDTGEIKVIEKSSGHIKVKSAKIVEAKPDVVLEVKPDVVIEHEPDAVLVVKKDAKIEFKPMPVLVVKPEALEEIKSDKVLTVKPEAVVVIKPDKVVKVKSDAAVKVKAKKKKKGKNFISPQDI